MSSIQRFFIFAIAVTMTAALFVSGCSGGASDTVTEAGSTTVQPLAEKLANAFKEKNPGVEIVIQGGGSSVGVKSCNDGTVDIGAISRELKPDEPDLVKHLLARDGIAIVVHPSNPLNSLTKEQVKQIFAGEISQWSDLGITGGGIHIIAREEGSGTRTAFEEIVMGDELVTAGAILLPSNGAIRTAIYSDPQAIGFLSLGYLDDSVKALAIDGVPCTEANARNSTYPVVRPLYFLTKGQPDGLVEEFIDFCFSSEGQQIVEDEGYIRVD